MSYGRIWTAALLLGLLLFGSDGLWALTSAPTWKPRETIVSGVVDRANHVAADRILAYDHYGTAGVVYSTEEDQLSYARKIPGAGWVSRPLDVLTPYETRYPSLTYDRYEYPRISYQSYDGTLNPPMGSLNYSYWDAMSNTWMNNMPDAAGYSGEFTSIATDVYGKTGISYMAKTMEGAMVTEEPALRFAYDQEGYGYLMGETVELGNVQATSLAFDGVNRPMIAYQVDNGIRFAAKEPIMGWARSQVVSGTLPDDAGPSLALAPENDFPAIAYVDANNKLAFAEWDGAQWTSTVVDDCAAASPSLAFDPSDGNPAIAYTSGGDLKFAWNDGSSWHTMVADGDPIELGFYPSLAFNDYGTGWPAIAYVSWDTLFFIEDPPMTAVPEPATLGLLALGILGAAGVRSRKSRATRRHS